MPKTMLIDAANSEEVRVSILENGKVDEFDFESAAKKPLRGNIYLARVTRVEPSLQAAFVEYGGNRHGFLAFSEIHPDYYQIPVSDRRAIQEAEAEEAALAAELNLEQRGDDGYDSGVEDVDFADRPERSERPERTEGSAEDGGQNGGRRRRRRSRSGRRRSENGRPENASAEAGGDAEPVSPDRQGAADDHSEAEEFGHDDDVGADVDHAVDHSHDDASFERDDDADEAGDDFEPPAALSFSSDAPRQETPYEDMTADETGDDAETDASDDEASEVDASEGEASDEDEDDEASDDDDAREPAPRADRGAMMERYKDARRRRIRLLRNYKIQEVIKRRQILLVQVVKEERGNKGAALTTYMSLAGRYCVLMPNTARGGGISRKIPNAVDRKRLRRVVDTLDVPQGMGLIIRTAGAKRTKAEIKRDYDYLIRLWENIRELTLKSIAPCLIYEEASLIKRAIRDMYDKDIEQVLVDGDNGYREAKDFMRMLMPSHAKNVQPYKEPTPLFLKYDVESQLEAMYQSTVRLRSGGYIVINQTEALIAIDVNSGKATRERNIEQTALKTNLEAAVEAARQFRLRDLAGLIVIDFIDMEEGKNNRAVEKRLKDALKSDRARIQVGRISNFGLLEMSRQRRRSGIVEGTTHACPTCSGAGVVRSNEMAALRILRAAEREAISGTAGLLAVRASLDVTLYILNHKREWLGRIEALYGVRVELIADQSRAGDQFEIEKSGVKQAPTISASYVRADLSQPTEETPEEPVADADADGDEDEVEATTREERPDRGERRGGEAIAGDESGGRRRRRRRRRRGGGGQSPDANAIISADDDQPYVGAPDIADETAEADRAGSEGGDEEQGPRGEDGDSESQRGRRRRRRGRRGGRRGRESQDGTGPSDFASSEEAPIAAAVTVDDASDEAPGHNVLEQRERAAAAIEAHVEATRPAEPEDREPPSTTPPPAVFIPVEGETSPEAPAGRPSKRGWWNRAFGN